MIGMIGMIGMNGVMTYGLRWYECVVELGIFGGGWGRKGLCESGCDQFVQHFFFFFFEVKDIAKSVVVMMMMKEKKYIWGNNNINGTRCEKIEIGGKKDNVCERYNSCFETSCMVSCSRSIV